VRRGTITKTGNAHLRRILVEAAWSYRHRPNVGSELRRRQANASEEVKEIAWKAQHRLHYRYVRLMARGKIKQQVVTAVARELAGFVWAIGVEIEKQPVSRPARAAARINEVEQSPPRPGVPRNGGSSAPLGDRASAWTRSLSPR